MHRHHVRVLSYILRVNASYFTKLILTNTNVFVILCHRVTYERSNFQVFELAQKYDILGIKQFIVAAIKNSESLKVIDFSDSAKNIVAEVEFIQLFKIIYPC